MPSLFFKDEEIESAPPIIGYKILTLLNQKKEGKISIFDVSDKFKNESWFSPKQIYLGMIFLFCAGLIDFQQPYIVKNAKN